MKFKFKPVKKLVLKKSTGLKFSLKLDYHTEVPVPITTIKQGKVCMSAYNGTKLRVIAETKDGKIKVKVYPHAKYHTLIYSCVPIDYPVYRGYDSHFAWG